MSDSRSAEQAASRHWIYVAADYLVAIIALIGLVGAVFFGYQPTLHVLAVLVFLGVYKAHAVSAR